MKPGTAAEDRMMMIYRMLSLSLMSFIFLMGPSENGRSYDAMLVSAALIVSGLCIAGYRKAKARPQLVMLLACAETLGVLALVLSSGGWSSPYRFYALLPMLTAVAALRLYHGVLLLVAYAGTLALITRYGPAGPDGTVSDLLAESFSLLFAAGLALTAAERIGRLKRGRDEAELRTKDTMEHIKSLYHIVETSSKHDFRNIGQVITEYAVKLTKQHQAFFWFAASGSEPSPESRQTGWTEEEGWQLLAEIEARNDEWRSQRDPMFRTFPEFGELLLMPVRMNSRFVGLIGMKLETPEGLEGRRWLIQQLTFLAELSAIILERHELGVIESRLIVTKEQNRIADEMHDSVSQSLFGIVYATHSLKLSWRKLSPAELEEQISLIHDSATRVAKELRMTIYSLSSHKSGSHSWLGMVRSHLNGLARLHAVDIPLSVTGDDFLLPYPYHKPLFRIISEATGNAIRHGGACRVEVELSLKARSVRLSIRDNGSGFDPGPFLKSPVDESPGGMGLKNMRSLTQSLGGEFQLVSSEQTGTRIFIHIPVGAGELKNA